MYEIVFFYYRYQFKIYLLNNLKYLIFWNINFKDKFFKDGKKCHSQFSE